MTITLYHCPPSPPSRCALLALRAAKIDDVEVKMVDLFQKEQLKPEFVAINPQHCVPTLNDNGFIMWESRAIAKYIATSYDKTGKLYPQGDPKVAANVDRLLYFDAGTLFPTFRTVAFPALFLGEKKVSQEKRDKVNETLGFLNTFLEGNKWVAGTNDYTIADLSILATVAGITASGWGMKSFPNITKWLENCSSIPGYKENQTGAEVFANAICSKLDKGEIY